MKFSKEFLQDMEGETLSEKVIDTRRWVIVYERIFEFEGKVYQTIYEVGATEQQDQAPYEYEENEIECPEFEAIKKTVIVYRKIKKED